VAARAGRVLMPPAVAILIPVLNRPQRIVPTIESVGAATPEPHRLLFVVSDDDRAELVALERAGADYLAVPAARGSWACKINDGYRATTEDWVFTGADDLEFRAGWFPRGLAWATPAIGVIGTNDLWNPRVMTGAHSTHSLVRRSYADEQGTADQPGLILHEGYPHQFADDELVATAMARDAYAHAFDSIVRHLRPATATDDTYRLGERSHSTGKRLFLSRRRLWATPAAPPAIMAPARAVVVTACYGGVDTTLHPQAAQDMPVDWICFTDRSALEAPPPWKVIHAPARFEHPCMAAKVHKATPTVDCPDVVWIDASMEVTSRSFVRDALASRHDGVAVFTHPRRRCIYTEADASLGVEGQGGKYAGQPLLDQVAHYRAKGHPTDAGLYACGVVAWDLADPKAVELGRQWLAECERWSWQDQLSFPVVCRRLDIAPGVFPVRQIERSGPGFLANRWLRIHGHTYQPAAVTSPAAAPTGVSVLIPYASDDTARAAARRYVLGWYASHHPAWEIIEGDCAGEWSKGRALADAATRASHDILVLADADSIVPADVLADAATRVAAGAAWVMPHRRVYRFDQAPTEAVYAGAEPEPNPAWCTNRRPYGGVTGGGITVLSRAAWAAVGGVDPRFVGWGGEDLAFGWALETLCGPGVHLGAPLFHLFHQQEWQGQRRRGSPESEALAGRYRDARNRPDVMRALVAEHAHEAVPA
jgi:hypothetical protein